MKILSLLFVSFSFVHVFLLLKTGCSGFFWVSRFFLAAEALQMGGIRSLPIWYRTIKRLYLLESKTIKQNFANEVVS